jgi:hypothetical protein
MGAGKNNANIRRLHDDEPVQLLLLLEVWPVVIFGLKRMELAPVRQAT